MFKIIIVVLLGLVLLSLSTALFSLLSDKGQSDRTVKALSIRIGLSIGLLVLLLIGNKLGFIQPHGVY